MAILNQDATRAYAQKYNHLSIKESVMDQMCELSDDQVFSVLYQSILAMNSFHGANVLEGVKNKVEALMLTSEETDCKLIYSLYGYLEFVLKKYDGYGNIPYIHTLLIFQLWLVALIDSLENQSR